jgi:hypothetical protein
MRDLQPCDGCRRHLDASQARSCPFCAATVTARARAPLPTGRLSRAAVFSSAALVAGCGGKPKQARTEPHVIEDENYQDHPCTEPDPVKIAELEKQRDEAQTDEEKRAIDEKLDRARMSVCAPYGAPPARRRIV